MVYIGIVTFNSKKDIFRCTQSIEAQTHEDLKIVIYDNRSEDGTREYIKKYIPNTYFIQGNENIGFGSAHNIIISACNLKQEDWYMQLNPDVTLDKHYISRCLACATRHHASWVIGKLYLSCSLHHSKKKLYSVGHTISRDGYTTNVGYGLFDQPKYNKEMEVFGASGAAVLYKSNFIKNIGARYGFYDTSMFMYGEDTDIDWRARLLGWHCWYNPEAIAYHRGSSPTALFRAHCIVNRYISVVKNASPRQLLNTIPFMIIHLLFRLIVTPALGFWMSMRLVATFFRALNNRTIPKKDYAIMDTWFVKNKELMTEPTGVSARVKRFFQRSNQF